MPTTFVVLGVLLCVVAALIVFVPARRASDSGSSLVVAGFALAMLVGTGGFYAFTSDWNWAPNGLPESPLTQQLYELQREVHDNENSASAWAELGRFYLQFETQLPAAIEALDRSVALANGQDIDTNLNLVEALAIRGAPNDAERSAEILNASLKIDPDHRKALWYASEVAAQLERWDVAIARWQRMLSDARSIDTDEARSVVRLLESRIAGARQQLAGGEVPQHGDDASAPEAIRVRVNLDRALAQTPGLKPSTPLFVFVRAAEQGGPPLAVHRSTVGQLPLDITLSDQDAMMPSRTISAFDQLQVVARISLSGAPTQSAGDLFGGQQLGPEGSRDVAIQISQVAANP